MFRAMPSQSYIATMRDYHLRMIQMNIGPKIIASTMVMFISIRDWTVMLLVIVLASTAVVKPGAVYC